MSTFSFNFFDKKIFLDRIFNGGIFRVQSGIKDATFCKRISAVDCFLERSAVWRFGGVLNTTLV